MFGLVFEDVFLAPHNARQFCFESAPRPNDRWRFFWVTKAFKGGEVYCIWSGWAIAPVTSHCSFLAIVEVLGVNGLVCECRCGRGNRDVHGCRSDMKRAAWFIEQDWINIGVVKCWIA